MLGYEHPKKALTCRCLTSGDLKWTMDIPNADVSRFYTTCDINGDGKDELILCTDRQLLAIHEQNGKGKIVFAVEIPSSCQGAVVADADGDGLPEILLSCDDGCLYMLK